MTPHNISSNNSKDTNHIIISLTGTEHCNSKISKNISLEKKIFTIQYFKKSARKPKPEVRILEVLRVSFQIVVMILPTERQACLGP